MWQRQHQQQQRQRNQQPIIAQNISIIVAAGSVIAVAPPAYTVMAG